MRIGLTCGPATGGVVGASMLRYHLFGPVTQEVRLAHAGGRAMNLGPLPHFPSTGLL